MSDTGPDGRLNAEFRFETRRMTRWLVGGIALIVEALLVAGLARKPSVWNAVVALSVGTIFTFWIVPMLSSATISAAGIRIHNVLRPEVTARWEEISQFQIVVTKAAFCRVTMLDGKTRKIRACTWIGSFGTIMEVHAWLGGRDSPLRVHYTPRHWGSDFRYRHDGLS